MPEIHVPTPEADVFCLEQVLIGKFRAGPDFF
jgi:hypothetical protein